VQVRAEAFGVRKEGIFIGQITVGETEGAAIINKLKEV
jgi:hypothetical protein